MAAAVGHAGFLLRQQLSFRTISTFQSHFLRTAVLPTVLPVIAGVGSFLGDIWEGILRAVPKKKTTHSKGRSRRLAGKALKDLTSLNTCSSCGRVKRMHVLCPYCVQNIKDMWADRMKKVTGEATKIVKK